MKEVVAKRQAGPVAVLPGEAGIDDAGRPAGASGLTSRGRVGPLEQAVQAVDVKGARLDAVETRMMIPPVQSLHPDDAAEGREDSQFNLCGIRRPDEKGAAAPSPVDGTQWQPSVHVRPPRFVFRTMQPSRSPWFRRFQGSLNGSAPRVTRIFCLFACRAWTLLFGDGPCGVL